MSDDGGIGVRLGGPLLAATALACGLCLAYFFWLGPDSAHLAKLAVLALAALSGIVAVLAAGLMFIARKLHDRIVRLEQPGEGSRPGRGA